MSRRRNVGISGLICVLCIVCCTVLILLQKESNRIAYVEEAVSYESLSVFVDFPGETKAVNIWQDSETGLYYFFLPSSGDNYELTFGNLGKNSTLRLGEDTYDSQDVLKEALEYGKVYEMELTVAGSPLEVQQLIFMKSENLPSLFVETASGSVDNIHESEEVREAAAIALFGADGMQEYSGNIEYIKCRGNSSFYYFEKKPYQIKLTKESPLLGMPGAKKWILLANGIDSTLIKNELVFRFAEKYTTVPSIRGEYVDLYMNGNYVGNYYLCEKVEVDENRLNIKGGYLVEHTVYEDPMPENCFRTDMGHYYVIVSPENPTEEQMADIQRQFNEMENAIQQEDGLHPVTGRHFSEYIDIDSWASKYVMEEVFHDPDSAELSMFFYKNADSIDTRIFSGPMWDYDRALGSYGYNDFSQDAPEQVGKCGIYVEEMMKHEEVRRLVYEKFREYVVPYVEYLVSADVHELYQKIGASAEMNQIRWPAIYGYYTDKDARKDYLIAFLKKKVDYLEDVWLDEKACQVNFLDYEGDLFESYTVNRGECLGVEPVITTWRGIFNGWVSVEDGIPFDARLPIYSDVTYQAEWIELDAILQNGLDIAEVDVSKADPEIFRQFADVLEEMQGALSEENNEKAKNE